MVIANGEWISCKSYTVGFPVISINLLSWFKVDEPGNKGLFKNNSATMQPRAHISTEKSYRGEPNKISGALYHLVAT